MIPRHPLLAPRRPLARGQRGLSLIGLIVVGVLLVFGAMLTLKIWPTVTEFLSIQRAVIGARAAGTDPQSIRSAFDRAAAIDDITSITGRDLKISRTADGYSVSFAYEKKIPLVGPASLLLEYNGDSTGRGAR